LVDKKNNSNDTDNNNNDNDEHEIQNGNNESPCKPSLGALVFPCEKTDNDVNIDDINFHVQHPKPTSNTTKNENENDINTVQNYEHNYSDNKTLDTGNENDYNNVNEESEGRTKAWKNLQLLDESQTAHEINIDHIESFTITPAPSKQIKNKRKNRVKKQNDNCNNHEDNGNENENEYVHNKVGENNENENKTNLNNPSDFPNVAKPNYKKNHPNGSDISDIFNINSSLI